MTWKASQGSFAFTRDKALERVEQWVYDLADLRRC
jgi:hypothetical protein